MTVIWHVIERATQASNGPGKNIGIGLAQRSDKNRFTMNGYYKQIRRESCAIGSIASKTWGEITYPFLIFHVATGEV